MKLLDQKNLLVFMRANKTKDTIMNKEDRDQDQENEEKNQNNGKNNSKEKLSKKGTFNF